MPTALVLTAAGRFDLDDRQRPVAGPGEVLVEVSRLGLCGTDLHIVEGIHPRARFPLVLGHELVGRVVGRAPGDGLVVVDPLISCGRCGACRLGERHVCAELRLIGIDRDGGLAGFVAVAAERVHAVPAGIDPDIAALTEPLAVAVHAARRGGAAPGDRVAIMGAGPIGLLLAFVARQMGAGRVFLSEPSSFRMAFAARLGYEMLDPSDPVGDLAGRTDGLLADVVFDAAGATSVAALLPRLVRPAGRIALVGVYGRPVELDLQAVVFREQTIVGNRVYTPDDINAALALLREGGDFLRPLISEVVPTTQVPAAFERLRSGDGVKILVALDGA